MESTVKQLDYDLLRELECPVCHEYMKPPITLCNNGHNVCNNCKPKLQGSCPICRANFLQARNVALENIARTAVYPCKNKDSGCKVILPMDKKLAHQSECFFESRKCPFAKLSDVNCTWRGILSEIKDHILNDHGFETDSRQKTGAFTVSLKDISASKCYSAAVFKLEELFFILWEIKEEDFFCTVMHIGTSREAADYKYRFTITTTSGMEIISTCYVAQSYLTDLDNILQPGECVTLHYGTVAKFLDERNTLVCEMEIYKIDTYPIEILRKCEVPPAKVSNLVPRSFVYYTSTGDVEAENEGEDTE